MAMEPANINGINVNQLNETIGNIKNDPGLAKANFRVTNRWDNGGHSEIKIHDFFSARQNITHKQDFRLDADEPPLLLGEDKGANPVEYVLTALSACLTTALIYNAAARGIELQEVESSLEGDLDLRGFLGISDKVRNGYDNIRVNFRIRSDAPQEQLDELVRLAQERSPVFDIVSNPVPVKVSAEKIREELH